MFTSFSQIRYVSPVVLLKSPAIIVPQIVIDDADPGNFSASRAITTSERQKRGRLSLSRDTAQNPAIGDSITEGGTNDRR
jgi:hypothetical protein